MIPLILTFLLSIDLPEYLTVIIIEKHNYYYGTGELYKERRLVIYKLITKAEYEKEKGAQFDALDEREFSKKGMLTIQRVVEHYTL